MLAPAHERVCDVVNEFETSIMVRGGPRAVREEK